MSSQQDSTRAGKPAGQGSPSVWSLKYGVRHALRRITDFPTGIVPPSRVRLYWRCDHFVLQWWCPQVKANLSDRVDGDLVVAIMRARQIEEQLIQQGRSGQGCRRLDHADLQQRFLSDLQQRADADVITPGTVERYRSALAHYLAFCQQTQVQKSYPYATSVNRDFRLAFSAFLSNRWVSANGHANTPARPLKGQAFILDAVRAMFAWAANPERGNLLPDSFRNPFLRSGEKRPLPEGDPLAEPDITLPMALDFVRACDLYQLRLFVPLLLFGLRAAEPCFLFLEYLDDKWLRVPCNPDLAYRTKGGRHKRFPLIDALQPFWELLAGGRSQGLLYQRRTVLLGQEKAPWGNGSLEELVDEFRARCSARRNLSAAERLRLRDGLLVEAGGINYDHLDQEFRGLARRLGWPRQATLKDFRHLFCTTLANAAIPEAYRRYLMGHVPEKAAVVAYTHLAEIRRHFSEAIRREWTPLVEAVLERTATLQPAEKKQQQPD